MLPPSFLDSVPLCCSFLAVIGDQTRPSFCFGHRSKESAEYVCISALLLLFSPAVPKGGSVDDMNLPTPEFLLSVMIDSLLVPQMLDVVCLFLVTTDLYYFSPAPFFTLFAFMTLIGDVIMW